MRIVVLTLALVVLCAGQAHAEWQLKPFIGLTFGGGNTFLSDLEHTGGKRHVVVGLNSAWLGELIGFEADLGRGPGFFQAGDQNLVASSSVTTLTGNVVVAWPRRLTEYTLRPYFVGGTGFIHARINDVNRLLVLRSTLPAVDLGGGATGFLSERVGVSWDVRHFRSFGGKERGLSTGKEHISFWRATMAVAFRY